MAGTLVVLDVSCFRSLTALISKHTAAGQARRPLRARPHPDRLPRLHVRDVHQKRHRCLQVRDGQGRRRVGQDARARQARGVLRTGRARAVHADEARAAAWARGAALGQRAGRAPGARRALKGVDADVGEARARRTRRGAAGVIFPGIFCHALQSSARA